MCLGQLTLRIEQIQDRAGAGTVPRLLNPVVLLRHPNTLLGKPAGRTRRPMRLIRLRDIRLGRPLEIFSNRPRNIVRGPSAANRRFAIQVVPDRQRDLKEIDPRSIPVGGKASPNLVYDPTRLACGR